jgi:intein/homing endonuclease
MTKKELVESSVKEKYDKYNLKIPFEKLPWSGEFIETKLNDGTIELVDRMVEFALCAIHSFYFIDRYCFTIDPQKGPIPLKLFDFQKTALDEFQSHSKNIFKKCLTKNNYLQTDRGYLSIKDVKPNDKILTIKDGSAIWDRVVNSWESGEKEVFKITTQNHNSIEATKDHKILTTTGWKEVQYLNKEDELVTTFNSDCFGDYELEDDKLLHLIGLYLADGRKSGTSFPNTNFDYIKKVFDAGCLFEDIDPRIVVERKQKVHYLQLYSVRLTTGKKTCKSNSYLEFAKKYGLNKKSVDRVFTSDLMNLNKRQMSILLNHLFSGDGWSSYGYRFNEYGTKYETFSIGIAVPNKIFILQIKEILSRYGIRSTIKKDKGKSFWRLSVHDKNSVLLFSKEIGIYKKIDSDFILKLENSIKYNSKVSSNKIKSIKKIGIEKVYDIETQNTHSFLSNGIVVHNCRQVGASVISGCYALWRVNFRKAQLIKIISLTQSDALEFKEKTIDINYYEMPGFLKTKTTRDGFSKTRLKLVNQSNLRVLSKSKNAGRGGTPSLVIIDEAAFNEWMDDIWKSIEPSLDKGGDVIVISTTNGVGNWYHLTYSRAEEKLNEFNAIYIPSIH